MPARGVKVELYVQEDVTKRPVLYQTETFAAGHDQLEFPVTESAVKRAAATGARLSLRVSLPDAVPHEDQEAADFQAWLDQRAAEAHESSSPARGRLSGPMSVVIWSRFLRLVLRIRSVPEDAVTRRRLGTWAWLMGRDVWRPDR